MSKTVVDLGRGYVLTESDLKFSRYRHKQEKEFIGTKNPVDGRSVYKAVTYSLLTAAQNTPKLIRVYDSVKRHGLNVPENVTSDRHEEVNYLLKGMRFPNVKKDRIKKLPEWWKKAESQCIVDELVKCVNENDVKKQKCVRHVLDAKGPEGVSRKTASLVIQCLAQDLKDVGVVTVDLWALKVLKDLGYKVNGREVRVPDGRTVPGMTSKEYLECERILTKEAERFGLSPGELGYGLWCKLAYVERNINGEISSYF
jgi:thermostable 8-oxoguanine DNA glycosylase